MTKRFEKKNKWVEIFRTLKKEYLSNLKVKDFTGSRKF